MHESQNLELKKSLSDTNGILESIVAFANSSGGRIIIGVDERSNKLVGVSVGDNTLENLARLITKSVYPPVYPEINVKVSKGKKIIEIVVSPSRHKPHFYKGIAYKRVGRSNVKLDPQEIELMFKERARRNFLEEFNEDAGVEDIDGAAVKKFVKEARESGRMVIREKSVSEILYKLNLMKKRKVKNLALFLFGKKPSRFFPFFSFKCAVSLSDEFDVKMLRDVEEYDLPFFFLVDRVVEYLIKYLPRHITIEGIRRVEEPFLSEEVLREIVVNSLVHRDYEVKSPNYLLITPSFFEVTNPGGLPAELDVKSLYGFHKSVLRNDLYAQIAYFAGYIDKWGSGTTKIVSECARRYTVAEFRSEKGFFSVRIPFKLSGVYLSIVEFLKKGPRTSKEIARKLKLSERTARRYLGDLIEKGIVKKSVKWRRVEYML